MQPDYRSIPAGQTFGVPRNTVLRNTYWLLGLSMIPTVVGALIGINMGFSLLRASPMLGSVIYLAVIYGLFYAIERNKESTTGVFLLLGLTFILGVMLGPILQFTMHFRNGAELITLAAGGTGVTFMVLSAIASSTKRDFSGMGNFLMAGSIVLMVAVVANIFLQLPMLQLALAGAFMIFSSMMILYQVNAIVQGGERNYITATLTLYISIYNIFVSLLQLLGVFGGQRD